MAILSDRRMREGPSSGHDFDRIHDKIHGHGKHKINKQKQIFSSDYIYMYRETSDDDSVTDVEIGVNANYHRYHSADWCNAERDEPHATNRFLDSLEDDSIAPDFADPTDEMEDFFGEDDGDE